MDAPLTHAGGIVHRPGRDGPEFLLVRPSSGADQWLFPKGHIDPGESPEAAAVREVREETGVDASVVAPVGVLEFRAGDEDVRVVYFVMRASGAAGGEHEARGTCWRGFDAAWSLLSFEDAKGLLGKAREMLVSGGRGS